MAEKPTIEEIATRVAKASDKAIVTKADKSPSPNVTAVFSTADDVVEYMNAMNALHEWVADNAPREMTGPELNYAVGEALEPCEICMNYPHQGVTIDMDRRGHKDFDPANKWGDAMWAMGQFLDSRGDCGLLRKEQFIRGIRSVVSYDDNPPYDWPGLVSSVRKAGPTAICKAIIQAKAEGADDPVAPYVRPPSVNFVKY